MAVHGFLEWEPIPEPSEQMKKSLERISDKPETYEDVMGCHRMRDAEGKWFINYLGDALEGPYLRGLN